MKHYTEVDLLEVHYLPAESLIPVHKHLSSCPECMSRYDSLQKKLSSAARLPCALVDQKPATFWDRQRFSIMRKIQVRPERIAVKRISRAWVAASAAMVMMASLVLVLTTRPEPASVSSNDVSAVVENARQDEPIDAAADIFQQLRAVNDPWNSEELSPFRGAVEWETWTTESPAIPEGPL